MADLPPGLGAIIAWDREDNATECARNAVLPASPVDMRGVRLWGLYAKSQTNGDGQPGAMPYLQWLQQLRGANAHACVGKVAGHGRVLLGQVTRHYSVQAGAAGARAAGEAVATAMAPNARGAAGAKAAADAKAAISAAKAIAAAEAATGAAAAEAKAAADAKAAISAANAKEAAMAAKAREATRAKEAADAKAAISAAEAATEAAAAGAKAAADARGAAMAAKAREATRAKEAADAQAAISAANAKEAAMAAKAREATRAKEAADAKAAADAATATAADTATATAAAKAVEATKAAPVQTKRVLRFSTELTRSPGAADYAAVQLRKNLWQLSNEGDYRFAVFAAPLSLSTRPAGCKPWRTKLFMSSYETSGLDSRTGMEFEACLDVDYIIEFSRI